MRRLALLAAAIAVASCQIQALEPPVPEKPTTLTRKARPAARPAATPTPEPTGEPTATSAATPTPRPTVTPAVPMMRLEGLVRIDAHYVVSTGAGSIIANNGGAVIKAAAGSLISNNGGSVVSSGGLGFRLLDAPAVGTLLPVQGMLVVPISLLTSKPLGPAVLTDETGAYVIQVPEAQKENVLILGGIPAKNEQDPLLKDARLRYAAIVAPRAGTGVLDEDEAVVTRYIREVFTERFFAILSRSEQEVEVYLTEALSTGAFDSLGGFSAIVKQSLLELHAEAAKAGTPSWPEAEQLAIARRLADAVLATIDPAAIKMDPTFYDLSGRGYVGWEATRSAIDPTQSVAAAMHEVIAFLRLEAARVMEEGGFASKPYLLAANARRTAAGLSPYEIKRPSDFCDYVMQEYGAPDQTMEFNEAEDPRLIYEDIGATALPGSGLLTQGVTRTVEFSILVALQKTLIADAAAKENLFRILREPGRQ